MGFASTSYSLKRVTFWGDFAGVLQDEWLVGVLLGVTRRVRLSLHSGHLT
jgi:hypothetical protein